MSSRALLKKFSVMNITSDEEQRRKEEQNRKNAERTAKYRAKKMVENPEEYKKMVNERNRKWREENPERNKEQNRKAQFNYQLSK